MTAAAKPTDNYKHDDEDQTLNIVAYMFAGLSMMLNIRLVYSAAPYALIRFQLPENLFSVFVRVMASSLELWCLPSMTIANIMEQVYNNTQDNVPGVHANNLKNAYENLKQKATALYNAANRLGAAYDNLKNAVGAQDQEGSVGSPNTLREALHQLANATPEELTSKACAVTSQYEEVKGLFAQVE